MAILNPVKATWDYLRGNDLKVLRAPEQKELPPFWPGVPPQPGPGLYQRFLPTSDATWVPGAPVSAGAAANSAVFACLNVICTAFPEPALRVYRRQNEGEPKALPEHPLQELLERPNPYHSVSELWYWVEFAKHVHGNAYLEKVRAGDAATGNVVELWPLSPTRVEPITTPEDRRRGVFISWYEYETEPGRRRRLRPEDVIHFRLGLEDADHRIGCSPLRRLLQEVASDEETTRFMLALLANFAVPGLIVTTPDRSLSAEAAEQLKQAISTRFSGDSRGTVGVLNNGATAAQFGFSPEQLDMKALHRVPEERISAVMGVPAIVAGLGAGLDRCLPADARVWTPAGAVRMGDVRPGMIVWSFVDGRLEPRRVLHQWKTGFRRVYEVRTKNRRLRATDNHPLLVRVPGSMTVGLNDDRHPSYAWRRLDQLRAGDCVVQVKSLPDQAGTTLPDGRPATPAMLQFLGALIGDGTVSGPGVRMAMPPGDRCVKVYRELAESLFTKQASASGGAVEIQETVARAPIRVQQRPGDFGFSSAAESRRLTGWGLGGRASTKRVPSWVWALSEELRLAFLAGIVDTDGHIDKRGTLTVSFCNRDLAHDVRDLLISVGVQACNVRHQVYGAGVLPQPGRREQYHAYAFTASAAPQVARIPFTDPLYRARVDANPQRERRDGGDAHKTGLSPDLGFYAIKEIREVEAQDVYDIEVEGGHSFVAEGLVVSNSTYSNVREAREMFTETKLVPLWNDDAGTVNLQLLPDFDRNRRTFCKFDLTDVRALQEDEDKKYARLDLGVQHKWITVNEARQDVGLPPVEGGDELAPPVPPPLPGGGNGALPDGQQGQRRLPPPGGEAALTGGEQKAIGLQLFPALMDAMVSLAMPGFQRDLEEFFREQRQRVLEAVVKEG